MSFEPSILLDRAVLARMRAERGATFVRLLGYFREDGIKAMTALEEAVRAGDAPAMVVPAHTLKGNARYFGAEPLASLAEQLEGYARGCIERRERPDEAISDVVALRDLFRATLSAVERESNPLAPRRHAGFGRRPD